jgi:hypothetical protein
VALADSAKSHDDAVRFRQAMTGRYPRKRYLLHLRKQIAERTWKWNHIKTFWTVLLRRLNDFRTEIMEAL